MGRHSSVDEESKTWPKENIAIFVQILYDKLKEDKLQTSTFKAEVWKEINEEMYAALGEDYGEKRLRGKWNRLRIRHRLFSSLLVHPEVRWDPNINQVDAPQQVWDEFYMVNKREYKAIRKEGFDHYNILGEIFGVSTTVVGLQNGLIRQLQTSDEEKQVEDDCLNKGVHVATPINSVACGNIRQRETELKNGRRTKEPKVDVVDRLEKLMEQWSNEFKTRQKYYEATVVQLQAQMNGSSGNEAATNQGLDLYPLSVCLDIINSIDELSDDAYSKGISAFRDEYLRMSFIRMPENRRKPWLERL